MSPRWQVGALACALVLAAGVAGCADEGGGAATASPKARVSGAATTAAAASGSPAAGTSGQPSAGDTESTPPSWVPPLSDDEQAARDAALATPEPTRLEGMDENSPYGASQAVGYFLNLYPYVYATGDLAAWREISGDDCIFCSSVIDNVTELHNSGGWSDYWQQEITVVSYGYDPSDSSRLVFETHIATPDRTAYSGLPIAPHTVAGGETVINVQVYWSEGHWIVEEGDVQ
ncbi:MAG: DUF6318 family protein [Actinomyces sp.]|nr:DUF6318 family protein [Actinomyces sp.]MDO4243657.1 DUF6318 family protein [Actinomyces sp.]